MRSLSLPVMILVWILCLSVSVFAVQESHFYRNDTTSSITLNGTAQSYRVQGPLNTSRPAQFSMNHTFVRVDERGLTIVNYTITAGGGNVTTLADSRCLIQPYCWIVQGDATALTLFDDPIMTHTNTVSLAGLTHADFIFSVAEVDADVDDTLTVAFNNGSGFVDQVTYNGSNNGRTDATWVVGDFVTRNLSIPASFRTSTFSWRFTGHMEGDYDGGSEGVDSFIIDNLKIVSNDKRSLTIPRFWYNVSTSTAFFQMTVSQYLSLVGTTSKVNTSISLYNSTNHLQATFTSVHNLTTATTNYSFTHQPTGNTTLMQGGYITFDHVLDVSPDNNVTWGFQSASFPTVFLPTTSAVLNATPSFDEVPSNTSYNFSQSPFSFTLNWTATNDALVTSNDSAFVVVTTNTTQTAAVTFTPGATGVYTVAFTVSNGEGSAVTYATYTVQNLNVSPTFTQVAINGSFPNTVVPFNFTLNWTGTNDALVTSNDSAFTIVTDNVTRTAFVVFDAPANGPLYATITVSNQDGSAIMYVVYTITQVTPIFTQRPDNRSYLNGSFTYQLNWTSSENATISVNDSRWILTNLSNDTRFFFVTWNASTFLGQVYSLWNISNSDGGQLTYTRNMFVRDNYSILVANTNFFLEFYVPLNDSYLFQIIIHNLMGDIIVDGQFQLNFTTLGSVFPLAYNEDTDFWEANLLFANVGDFPFILESGNITYVFAQNITGLVHVRPAFDVCFQIFTDRNTTNSYENDLITLLVYQTPPTGWFMPQDPRDSWLPGTDTLSFPYQVFHTTYDNGQGCLEVFDALNNYTVFAMDGVILFQDNYDVPNIQNYFGTMVPIYEGKLTPNTLYKVYIPRYDIVWKRLWFKFWPLVLLIVLVGISLVLGFLSASPLLGIISFLLSIIVWFFLWGLIEIVIRVFV